MHPSRIGELAEARWLAIPAHHPHILLDAFVVMPNHLHGILHIIAPPSSSASSGRLTYARVFGPPDAGSISTVMRSYKASVTRECRKQGLLFRWHTRFYDRIIRNENALKNVRNYIHQNPIKWHFKYNTPKD
ncbi:MAG: transposase [Rhodothermales bacterium]